MKYPEVGRKRRTTSSKAKISEDIFQLQKKKKTIVSRTEQKEN